LLTLHVPLRIGICTLGVHVPQVGNPWLIRTKVQRNLKWRAYLRLQQIVIYSTALIFDCPVMEAHTTQH